MKFVLGSSSKFRRAVFSQVVDRFECISPDIDEKAVRHEDPRALTRMVAHAKADAVVPKVGKDTIIVTADQVVHFEGEVREKPISVEECRAFLRSYANTPVEIINGIVVTNTQTGKRVEGNDVVRVLLKELPEQVIDTLIQEGDVLHCAGGLKAEHPMLAEFLVSMEGTVESLNGVPIDLTKRLIRDVKDS